MKNIKFYIVGGLVFFMTSCSNDTSKQNEGMSEQSSHEQYLSQIKKYETEMHSAIEINNVTAGLAIKAYTDYATFFPDDSITPFFLFKAGEIATATHQYLQALMYYKNITDNYSSFKYIQESLFLQGFLLDNYLNDDKKAKVVYEQVIAKYPGSPYANDAKAAIANLGKSDEELIKEFKRKNKEE